MWHPDGCPCPGCYEMILEAEELEYRSTPVYQLTTAAETEDEDEVHLVLEWLDLDGDDLDDLVKEVLDHLSPEVGSLLLSIVEEL